MKRLILENQNSIVSQINTYLDNNSEAKFIQRLQVVLLFASSEKESCDSLGKLFGNSPRSVSNWIKRVNKTGNIESLRNKPLSGRPSRLTKSQKTEIKTILQDTPEKQGICCKKWNGKILSSFINKRYGIELKERSCQRLFNELSAII